MITVNDVQIGDKVTLENGEEVVICDKTWFNVYIKRKRFGAITTLKVNNQTQEILGLAS